MARQVKVAAAQMGPINEGTSRDEVVDRMLVLLEQAITEQVEPDRLSGDGADDVLPQAHPRRLRSVLRERGAAQGAGAGAARAREKGVAVHVGFCEKAEGTTSTPRS